MSNLWDEIFQRLFRPNIPQRLPGVPDVPIMQNLEMAIPLSAEDVKALNWILNYPRHDPRRN